MGIQIFFFVIRNKKLHLPTKSFYFVLFLKVILIENLNYWYILLSWKQIFGFLRHIYFFFVSIEVPIVIKYLAYKWIYYIFYLNL